MSRGLWLLFFGLLIVIAFLSFSVSLNHDEVESIHVAWKIFSGERIYVDFFEHHHPFYYYLLIPIIKLFNGNTGVVFAARALSLGMLLLVFAVTYDISRNVFGKRPAVISLVLLATVRVFIYKVIEIRPDVPEALFGLISVSLLLNYFKRNTLKYLILSAVSLGLSFLFLQKAIFLVFVIGVVLLHSWYFDRLRARDMSIYLAVLIAVLAPFYILLFINGQLHAYLFYNWVFNTVYLKNWSVDCEKVMLLLISLFKGNPLIWVSWLLSLLFLDTDQKEKIAIISFLFLIIFFMLQIYIKQYLILLIPFIAMMAGYGLDQAAVLFFKNGSAIIGIIVGINLFCPLESYSVDIKKSPIFQDLKEIEYVQSITRPADYVYDPSRHANLYRKDLDFYWSKEGIKHINSAHQWKPENYDVYALIEKFKPKVIVESMIKNLGDHRIRDFYKKSDRYQEVLIRADGQ